ncbi:uncharacterized protein LOC117320719 [Pecten maximus]|uniref:uncharacterized protein LOC117319422 n=1 Tax=Pecten maximus TaxID=6579 RepID=UPI001459118E|nr:uncharacterized protein LOC117319422 [Pecten maximus]XP_033730680.1 uncharacterized protein LOC117320119 [Pecten maximus]XP_033731121.1 uncharacterized protein LOC117320719 [Pecten maximus]
MADEYPWQTYFEGFSDAYHGYVYEIDDTIDVIREFSYATSSSYAVTRCTKNFGSFNPGGDHKEDHFIRFTDDNKLIHAKRLSPDGIPFMNVGLKLFECHQGPSHRKSSAKSSKQTDAEHGYSQIPSKRRLTGTKKRGCPASILLREIIFFPEYKVSSSTSPYHITN